MRSVMSARIAVASSAAGLRRLGSGPVRPVAPTGGGIVVPVGGGWVTGTPRIGVPGRATGIWPVRPGLVPGLVPGFVPGYVPGLVPGLVYGVTVRLSISGIGSRSGVAVRLII